MITPYYDRNGITIYCGDCLEIMPQLAGPVDAVITDTPYGIDGSRGTINLARGKGNYHKTFYDTREYLKTVIVPFIEQCIKKYPCVILTPGNSNFSLYPQPDSFGCFYQPAAVGLQTFGNLDSQPIFYYGKNITKRNMGTPCSYQVTENPGSYAHPCVKPLRAWSKLVRNFTLPNHLILDPFMGSGTTLVAAQNEGRRAIGIELSEEYCRIAVDRLHQPSFWSLPTESKEPVKVTQLGLM
jgi:site-specific DNA-methyltransferase (adenine-specific)